MSLLIETGAGAATSEAAGAVASLLPKKVRFVGPTGDSASGGLLEFEVVTGNAAYGAGERFYLTPAQARRANLAPVGLSAA